MNMAFNASTMWKNHHLALPTKKLVSFSLVPLNLHYDRFIIWRRNQIQANCIFYWVKLVPSKRSNFIKAIQFHQTMVQHFQSCTIIYSFHCSKYCLKIVGDLWNQGVIMKEQNEHIKQIYIYIYIYIICEAERNLN